MRLDNREGLPIVTTVFSRKDRIGRKDLHALHVLTYEPVEDLLLSLTQSPLSSQSNHKTKLRAFCGLGVRIFLWFCNYLSYQYERSRAVRRGFYAEASHRADNKGREQPLERGSIIPEGCLKDGGTVPR